MNAVDTAQAHALPADATGPDGFASDQFADSDSGPPARLGAPVVCVKCADAGPAESQRVAAAGPENPAKTADPSAPAATIDLGAALRLAGVENPTINLAREQAREALANELGARALLLPSLNVGGNYRRHAGALQDDPGEFRDVTLRSLYLGAGAGAVGGNPAAVPGVRLFANLGDAVYEPLAARQQVAARRSDAQAVQNQVLLEVTVAYLELVAAEARLDILRAAEAEAVEIARVTAEFARTGQGTPSDANRAQANVELLRGPVRQAAGGVEVASARLSRLLNLDPAVRLASPHGPVEPVRLVPEDAPADSLVTAAVRSRPEVGARAAAVQEAQVRVRQAWVQPLLPTVSVGYSAGVFGGGGNLVTPAFGPLRGRADFDAVVVWSVPNLGFGTAARARAADAVAGQAAAGYDLAVNRVRREVAVAQADALAAARQLEPARAALAAAEEGYRLERDRVHRGEGRPIEVLDSLRQRTEAQQEVLRVVVAFNVAQFRLFVAVGNTPVLVPACRVAGP